MTVIIDVHTTVMLLLNLSAHGNCIIMMMRSCMWAAHIRLAQYSNEPSRFTVLDYYRSSRRNKAYMPRPGLFF